MRALSTCILMMGFCLAGTARGTIVYSGTQNIVIPNTASGFTLDFTDPNDPSVFAGPFEGPGPGWDFHLTFGGAGIENSANSYPVTVSDSSSDIARLFYGDVVDGKSPNPGGASTSTGHMGSGSSQWESGDTGNIGYVLNPEVDEDRRYGWINVTLRDDGEGQINWWAWDVDGLAVTLVPEPSAGGVSAVCLLSGLLLQRRRRRAVS